MGKLFLIFNIYLFESVEPFKRKLCLNIPWMVLTPTDFCVFWANKNSKISAIAEQSFNIGSYLVNWIDNCFQKLQTFFDYAKTTRIHKWSLDGPWPNFDFLKFLCGMEVFRLPPFAGEVNIGRYGKIIFWKIYQIYHYSI